jgi:hypothetical protein
VRCRHNSSFRDAPGAPPKTNSTPPSPPQAQLRPPPPKLNSSGFLQPATARKPSSELQPPVAETHEPSVRPGPCLWPRGTLPSCRGDPHPSTKACRGRKPCTSSSTAQPCRLRRCAAAPRCATLTLALTFAWMLLAQVSSLTSQCNVHRSSSTTTLDDARPHAQGPLFRARPAPAPAEGGASQDQGHPNQRHPSAAQVSRRLLHAGQRYSVGRDAVVSCPTQDDQPAAHPAGPSHAGGRWPTG